MEISKENLSDKVEKIIVRPIENLEDNFWSTIISDYGKALRDEERTVKNILVDGFKVSEDEYDYSIMKYEDDMYKFCVKVIEKSARDLNSHLNRKFNSIFKKDDKGKHRSWKDIPEEEIKRLHESCFNEFEKVYDNFAYIELAKQSNSDGPTMTGNMSRKKDTLLSPEEITKIREKFEDDCEHALEEAIRLHHNIYGGGVPIYFWALFVFFAYDDIFRYLASPIFFYPLVFFGMCAALLQSLGLLMPLYQAARISLKLAYSQILEQRRG